MIVSYLKNRALMNRLQGEVFQMKLKWWNFYLECYSKINFSAS